MAELLDGRTLSKKILREIKEEQLGLSLAVVLVGGDPASRSFIKQKEKACEAASIKFRKVEFEEKINQEDLIKEIKKISEENNGLVVQLPLPPKFNSQEVLNSIPPEKDPDVLSQKGFEEFESGTSLVLPPVVGAVNHFLKEYSISLSGKKVVLLGKGRLVGKPLSVWFNKKEVEFSVIEKDTEKPEDILKEADLIISGIGRPNTIKGEDVKEGAVVIDAGTSLDKGQLTGDVDFKEVSKKASYITPVPGGLGPLTVACLLENLLNLNK